MEVTITANGKTFHRSGIRHALVTAVGNASLPQGFEPLPPTTAFNRIVEQMLLNALKDFQQSGSLLSLNVLEERSLLFPSASDTLATSEGCFAVVILGAGDALCSLRAIEVEEAMRLSQLDALAIDNSPARPQLDECCSYERHF